MPWSVSKWKTLHQLPGAQNHRASYNRVLIGTAGAIL
jgi:hypothetical protein